MENFSQINCRADFPLKTELLKYSWNPNKRAGPNKREGLQISENLINVQGGMHPSYQKIDKYYIKIEWLE